MTEENPPQSVEDFLRSDFIIPSHGGSMAPGFTGTAAEAQRIIAALTKPRSGK